MDVKRAENGDDDEVRAEVEAVMSRLVDGDRDALWDLHALAEQPLRRMIRAEARRIDVRIGEDDLLDLTIDAAIELRKVAHAWKPGGALPWVWARMRIPKVLHDHVGQFATPLDDEHLDIEAPPTPPPVDDVRAVLRRLAERHPAAVELERHLTAVASDRDAEIYLGMKLEQATGNRAPAVTVGADHDLRPETVRKVVQRVGERLDAVA